MRRKASASSSVKPRLKSVSTRRERVSQLPGASSTAHQATASTSGRQRKVDTSPDGFALAMDVSTHSFVRLAARAEPLMIKAGGGALVTMTYLGSEKVIPNYGVMGLCKAALEAATRYLAAELGSSRIRVNAVSPGPLMTRAASGIAGFDGLMAAAVERAPMHSLVTPEDVGALTAFLVSDAGRLISAGVHFVDAGYNIMA